MFQKIRTMPFFKTPQSSSSSSSFTHHSFQKVCKTVPTTTRGKKGTKMICECFENGKKVKCKKDDKDITKIHHHSHPPFLTMMMMPFNFDFKHTPSIKKKSIKRKTKTLITPTKSRTSRKSTRRTR